MEPSSISVRIPAGPIHAIAISPHTKPEMTTSQYITFKLGDELFAIDVAQVREVLEVSTITKVPTAPACMRGVVNVRGQATPVVDLRLRFGLPQVKDTVHTRIIVVELQLDGEAPHAEATVLGGI